MLLLGRAALFPDTRGPHPGRALPLTDDGKEPGPPCREPGALKLFSNTSPEAQVLHTHPLKMYHLLSRKPGLDLEF